MVKQIQKKTQIPLNLHQAGSETGSGSGDEPQPWSEEGQAGMLLHPQAMDGPITRRRSPRVHLSPAADLRWTSSAQPSLRFPPWSVCSQDLHVVFKDKSQTLILLPSGKALSLLRSPHMRSHGCCPSSTSVLQRPHLRSDSTSQPLVFFFPRSLPRGPFDPSSVTYPRVS